MDHITTVLNGNTLNPLLLPRANFSIALARQFTSRNIILRAVQVNARRSGYSPLIYFCMKAIDAYINMTSKRIFGCPDTGPRGGKMRQIRDIAV
jgi:hypothetical protein